MVVALFAARGLLRGAVAQVFVLLGMVGGLWAAAWVYHALGRHWADAQPALAYLALRWLVCGLAGLAVASLFQWWGDLLHTALKGGPLVWLDRVVGIGLGALVGAVVTTLLLLGALAVPWPRQVQQAAASARTTGFWMTGGEAACRVAGDWIPGSPWLAERLRRARLRPRPIPS